MNERDCLVLLKGTDRTSEVTSVTYSGKYVKVEFKYGASYNYNYCNAEIIKNPIVVDIENKIIYHKDMPLNNVRVVLRFGDKVKVIYHNGISSLYEGHTIKIYNNIIMESQPKEVLNYWKEISKCIKGNSKYEEGFIKKQYDKMKYINPESILGYYLKKKPLAKSITNASDIIFPFAFNLSQKEALNNVFKSNISIIEGPPGTGKTQTILNIIVNLAIIRNKSVAVVSNNNSAVENVLEKLEKSNYGYIAATLGKQKNIERFFDYLPIPKIQSMYNHKESYEILPKIQKINDKLNYLMQVNNEKSVLQQKLSAYKMEKQHFDMYFDNMDIESIKRLSFYKLSPKRIISFLTDQYMLSKQEKQKGFLYKVKMIIKHGIKDFSELETKEMDVILRFQKLYYFQKIESLQIEIRRKEKILTTGHFNNLIQEHEHYSKLYLENKLYQKYNCKGQLQLTKRNYKCKFKDFIEHPVILSTTHSLRNCIPENYMLDYLIIDESSQVDLLTGALALSCCKNAIIVGDTKQLPQIADETARNIDDKAIDHIYSYTHHNVLSSLLELYSDEVPRKILEEHYRCHPKIIEFCNQKYYDGKLIPFTDEKIEDNALVLFRTSEGNHTRKVTNGNDKGVYNQRELDVIKDEVLEYNLLYSKKPEEIGIVTPYRKQADKADKMLKLCECDTVHKYQGREKSIMVMSTVLDNKWESKKGIKFVDNPCIINVAVSRAINQFILVTDKTLFSNIGTEVRDLVKYMEYHTLDENIVESNVVSVFDLLYKEYSYSLRNLEKRILNKSKYKSENIMYTLINDILVNEQYKMLTFTYQVYLKNIVRYKDQLDDEEIKYIRNNASVDFVIYYKLDKQPILAIEVDGFAYHENKPDQLIRDKKKNNIFRKSGLELLRLPTSGSKEEEKICNKLDEILNTKMIVNK